MGNKDRGKRGTWTLPEAADSSRPVFTDNKTGDIEFTGYVVIKNDPKYLFSLSSGWVWYYHGVKWSWLQYAKYKLRLLLRLPIESDDPRDLVTWRLLKRR